MSAMNNGSQQYNESNESYEEARINEQCNYQITHPFNPAPAAPIKLFVSSIPKDLTENELKSIFEEFGPIKDVTFIKDKKPNMNRANVFIRMESIYYALQAIKTLHAKKIICDNLGPIVVKFAIGELEKYGLSYLNANDNDAKLFVGSLPKNITEDDIRNIFNRYGNITDIYIMKNNNGVSKRCAFVNYPFKEQGIFAIQNLNGKMPIENAEKPIEVRFAESKTQIQEKQMINRSVINPSSNNSFIHSQQFKAVHVNSFNRYPVQVNYNMANANQQRSGSMHTPSPWKQYFSKEDARPYYHNEMTGQIQWNKPRKIDQVINSVNINELTGPAGANIFIFHIPNEWSQTDLLSAFSPFGNIVSAHIATEKNTGRNRGFAFVSYDNVDSAINAVKYMNGFLAHKKKLKVTIKKGEEQYVQALLTQRSKMGNNDNYRSFINSPHS